MVSDGIGARGVFLIAARATCRPSRPDFRVGANALAGVRWLGCRGFAVRGVGAPTQIAKSFVSSVYLPKKSCCEKCIFFGRLVTRTGRVACFWKSHMMVIKIEWN